MSMQPTANPQKLFIFQLDKKVPMRIVWTCMVFIYVLQYPLSQLLPHATPMPQYDWNAWLVAYSFVLSSLAVFIPTLYIGLSGRQVKIATTGLHWKTVKRMSLPVVIIVLALFGLWSYLMVNLHIGMTIYTDFDALPFRLTGILFYGRLFVQPLVLCYIAIGYTNTSRKWILFLLLAALGAWVSLSSGSRFVALIFALPMLLLFKGKSRYLVYAIVLLCYITIASWSRNFYLPYIIGGEILQIYANDEYQESVTEEIYVSGFFYIIERTMGIAEVLMTLNFGDISPSFTDALESFLFYFLPYTLPGRSISVKNIYGFSDDAFGGLGLDLFSNFWVLFGGEPLLYFFGLVLISWMMGKMYRLYVIGLAQFGVQGFNNIIFVMLFILLFEGRGFLFPSLLLVGWLFSRKNTPRILLGMLGS